MVDGVDVDGVGVVIGRPDVDAVGDERTTKAG